MAFVWTILSSQFLVASESTHFFEFNTIMIKNIRWKNWNKIKRQILMYEVIIYYNTVTKNNR